MFWVKDALSSQAKCTLWLRASPFKEHRSLTVTSQMVVLSTRHHSGHGVQLVTHGAPSRAGEQEVQFFHVEI